MGRRTVNLCRDDIYTKGIEEAIEVLDGGGLVVLPTETVYGVAARADRSAGVKRLCEAKQRAVGVPFTLHIGCRGDVERYVVGLGRLARRFVRKGLPGPLTLLLSSEGPPPEAETSRRLDDRALGTLYHAGTIGLRCPDDPIAESLLRRVSGPVVIASANRAGFPPPSTVEQAIDELDGHIDLALDGGPTRYSKPSTIVRILDERYEVVRTGVYDERMVRGLASVTLLFVCTGNTCRSPMAGGIARRLVAERLGCAADALDEHNVRILSAGTAAVTGAPASPHALEVLAERGIPLGSHTSSPLTAELIHQADHIFAMTAAHARSVVSEVPSAEDRTQRLSPDGDIEDPFGGDSGVYASCADTIEKALIVRLNEVEL